MPGRQTPPGKGGQGKPLFFGWVPTARGEKWPAYIAGPAQWYECHHVTKSKPCLWEVTGGELECPHCAAGKFTETIGYLPLFRGSDSKPCCVLLHADVRESVDRLKFLEPVLIAREEGKSDGVFVGRPMSKMPAFHTTMEAKQSPADIWCSLVRMWAVPALIEWDARKQGHKSGGVLHPPAGTPTVPPMPVAPPAAGPVPAEQPVSALLGRLLDVVSAREQKADDRTALDGPDRPPGAE